MLKKTIESHLSIGQIKIRFNNKVSKSFGDFFFSNGYVGRLNKRKFILKYNNSIKNPFKKMTKGEIEEIDKKTIITYYYISSFLSWRIYVYVLLFSLLMSLVNYTDINSFIDGVMDQFLLIGGYCLAIGVIGQLIPPFYQKKKTEEFFSNILQ